MYRSGSLPALVPSPSWGDEQPALLPRGCGGSKAPWEVSAKTKHALHRDALPPVGSLSRRLEGIAETMMKFGFVEKRKPSLDVVLRDMRQPIAARVRKAEAWHVDVQRLRGGQDYSQVDSRPVPSWNFRCGKLQDGNFGPAPSLEAGRRRATLSTTLSKAAQPLPATPQAPRHAAEAAADGRARAAADAMARAATEGIAKAAAKARAAAEAKARAAAEVAGQGKAPKAAAEGKLKAAPQPPAGAEAPGEEEAGAAQGGTPRATTQAEAVLQQELRAWADLSAQIELLEASRGGPQPIERHPEAEPTTADARAEAVAPSSVASFAEAELVTEPAVEAGAQAETLSNEPAVQEAELVTEPAMEAGAQAETSASAEPAAQPSPSVQAAADQEEQAAPTEELPATPRVLVPAQDPVSPGLAPEAKFLQSFFGGSDAAPATEAEAPASRTGSKHGLALAMDIARQAASIEEVPATPRVPVPAGMADLMPDAQDPVSPGLEPEAKFLQSFFEGSDAVPATEAEAPTSRMGSKHGLALAMDIARRHESAEPVASPPAAAAPAELEPVAPAGPLEGSRGEPEAAAPVLSPGALSEAIELAEALNDLPMASIVEVESILHEDGWPLL